MKKYLINYAHHHFKKSQQLNSHYGKTIGNFDEIISYGFHDLDSDFVERNNHILCQKRGAGYWLWKPYLILKTLQRMDDGDWLFYMDSGTYILHPIDILIRFCQEKSADMLFFRLSSHLKVKLWTKRDCLEKMHCDEAFLDKPQILAGYNLYRKTQRSIDFVHQWLAYAQDETILTDMPNQCGLPNHEGFREHRHDQSILSILGYRHGVTLLPNIAGSENPANFEVFPLVKVTRDRR